MNTIAVSQRSHAPCIGCTSVTSSLMVAFRHWKTTPAAIERRNPRRARAANGVVMDPDSAARCAMTGEVVANWWWIPITVWAAFAQTIRNAAQRSLTAELGTWGATLVRFLYGLPFAAIWLFAVQAFTAEVLPALNSKFLFWTLLGAVSQIIATGLLLRTMQERNFGVGVAYSKSEVLQVAIFAFVFLGDPLTIPLAIAVALGTAGVLFLSGSKIDWAAKPALLGL